MLQIAKKPDDIDIDKLLKLYDIKGENAQDLISYITDTFFNVDGSAYYIFTDAGNYITALRTEPYQDGFLISGLHTHTSYRRQGYATLLLRTAVEELSGSVYSHIACNNIASIRVHSLCGFKKICDYARLLDGTVSSRYITMKL